MFGAEQSLQSNPHSKKHEPFTFSSDYVGAMRSEPEYRINEELVRRYCDGDREALKMLIKRFHPRLTAKVFYYTKDRDSLEDLVQESWLSIIPKLGDVQFQIGFEPWALSIARNKAIDWIRRRQSERRRDYGFQLEATVASEGEEVQEGSRNDQIRKLRESIALLPNTQRIILSLFYLEGHSIKEISGILAVSAGTVKSRLFNAREQLKEIIQP